MFLPTLKSTVIQQWTHSDRVGSKKQDEVAFFSSVRSFLSGRIQEVISIFPLSGIIHPIVSYSTSICMLLILD